MTDASKDTKRGCATCVAKQGDMCLLKDTAILIPKGRDWPDWCPVEPRKVEFYSTEEHCEVLSATDSFEALALHVQSRFGDIKPGDTVMLYHWARQVLPPAEKWRNSWLLETLLEEFDEEYGGPDGTPHTNEADKRMQEAELAFIAAVRAAYVPWTCEIVKREEIDLHAWCEKNCSQRPLPPKPPADE